MEITILQVSVPGQRGIGLETDHLETWKNKVGSADIEDHSFYEGLPGVLGLFLGG